MFQSARTLALRSTHTLRRFSAAVTGLTQGEERIYKLLQSSLAPAKLNVKDVSGGCGAMYAVEVASVKFKGQSLVKQHRMVVAAIEEEIKSAHGVQIKTEVAEN
ncbi:bola-like protein [Chytriomyces cf. hyalinus JEL632]|nr:bola-like protein [Chytriomyces cf. hyalinus JEL632]